jgi:hypothetical protein
LKDSWIFAVDEIAAVPDVNVLLGDLGDPKFPDRLARRVDRVSGSLLAGDVLVPTTSIAAIT